MLVIRYFNWLGTDKQLEEFTTAVKNAVKKTSGTKYLGKFGCMNQNWHWASVLDIKDWETFAAFAKNMDYNMRALSNNYLLFFTCARHN